MTALNILIAQIDVEDFSISVFELSSDHPLVLFARRWSDKYPGQNKAWLDAENRGDDELFNTALTLSETATAVQLPCIIHHSICLA